jgi:hypothetical protein
MKKSYTLILTTSLQVVYDAASERRQVGESTVAADVFRLPRTAAPSRA